MPKEDQYDEGCICKGNWRLLVNKYGPKFGQRYKTFWGPEGKGEYEYTFFGLVHAEDDYYYGMASKDGKVRLLSCVGDIQGFGFEEIP